MLRTLISSLALAIAALSLAPAASFASDPVSKITTLDAQQTVDRGKRVKGGSGCDDPEDVIEHPECR